LLKLNYWQQEVVFPAEVFTMKLCKSDKTKSKRQECRREHGVGNGGSSLGRTTTEQLVDSF